VTEVASQFAISIRKVQLTVHHDPEFKKAFVHNVCYEELCEEHNFNVRKPACNIRTNKDTSLLTTEHEKVHGMDNSYTSKTAGILGRTNCQQANDRCALRSQQACTHSFSAESWKSTMASTV